MKKVSIIGTVGLPAKYGGFETLADNLTKRLSTKFDITVYCSGKSYSEKHVVYNGAKLKYINLKANGVQSILYDAVSIIGSLRTSNTLLILGVSGCFILPIAKLFNKVKLIINIDGLEWKRQKWGPVAKFFLKLSERLAVKHADIVIADNPIIQSYIMQEYHKKSVFIAYGGDHITKPNLSSETINKYPFLNQRYALNVCRIVPENNIHIILEAFKIHSQTNLLVFGDWASTSYSKDLKDKYCNVDNIFLLDPMYDQVDIKNEIRNSSYIYVHGHSAGGTSPSLVEAMCLSKPIIAYNVDYNREATFGRALYFDGVKDLVNLLDRSTPEELKKNGEAMLKISNRNYTWHFISNEYAKLF